MRKLIASLLVLALVCSLAACGNSGASGLKLTPEAMQEIVNKSKDTQNTAPETEAAPEEKAATEEEPSFVEATIEETVLVNADGLKITAKEMEYDSYFGPELKLQVENKTGKDICVQCEHATINGYMVDTVMSINVTNGKTAIDTVSFNNLDRIGIDAIADMQIEFRICDADYSNYRNSDVAKLKTSIADTYQYTFDDSGELLYDDGSIKVVFKGLEEEDDYYGPTLWYYLENNTNKTLTFSCDDISINGFMVSGLLYCEILPGMKAIDYLSLDKKQYDGSGITQIDEIDFSVRAYDDNYQTVAETGELSLVRVEE